MKKIMAILLAAALAVSLFSACGGSTSDSDSAGGSASDGDHGQAEGFGSTGGSGSPDADGSAGMRSGDGEITWSWGTLRGLYGDAEVTFNEDGGRESVLMYYPGGALYRQIEYSYDLFEPGVIVGDKKVYPTQKITKNAGGSLLYTYGYEWSPCESDVNMWGAGVASDITPILEAGELLDAGETPEASGSRYYSSYEYGYDNEKEESTEYASYQELSHLIVSGQYKDVCRYGGGYWLTKRVDGNPAKTWFYAEDGRLDEDLTITWHYENNQPVDLQLGQYSTKTYLAEVSDGGRTVTYTLDESHTGEGDAEDGETAEAKDLQQVYTFTLTWQEDGVPAMFQYDFYKEYMNTDDPGRQTYTITYQYENGVLAGAEYRTKIENEEEQSYTLTCNAAGMLETENNLLPGIGSGDIGAKAYTYYDSGMLQSVTGYGDFTTEDPARIEYVKNYSEEGWLSGEILYDDGEITRETLYFENGDEAGRTTYLDGRINVTYTYNENGVYTMYESYRDNGDLYMSGEMTGENEFTMYYNEEDGKRISSVYTYRENEFEKTTYEKDGSVYSVDTYSYHDGENHQKF